MLSCKRNKTMQKDKHTFKRARLYFTSSSVCTFQSDCIALLPSPCQACVFHTLFNIKGLDGFCNKLFKRMYFPSPASQGLCVSTNAQELVCSVRERVFVCLCLRSLVAGADQPKGPSGSCALPRPASRARYSLSCCCPTSTVCHFFLPTPRTSRRKHRTYLPTLPLLSHQQAECFSA